MLANCKIAEAFLVITSLPSRFFCTLKILIDRDEKSAIAYTKSIISDLLQDRVDLSMLVISKSLGKEDYAAKVAHVELARRMRKRDPASAPVVGDRVAYVITKGTAGIPSILVRLICQALPDSSVFVQVHPCMKEQKILFLSWRTTFRSIRPIMWITNSRIRLPVSSSPFCRIPTNYSVCCFLFYLASS